MKALYMCPSVNIKIMGVNFWARLIVLDSKDLDVILGMNWLGRHDATIQCAKRTVLLTSSSGEKIELVCTLPAAAEGSVHQLDGKSLEDIKVVCDYPDVFPNKFQVCHLTEMLSLLLIYYLVLLLFLSVHIECLVINYLSLRSRLRIYWKRDSFGLVHHLGGHRLSLWRRRMVLRGCVWIIDHLMRLQLRINILCLALKIYLIS